MAPRGARGAAKRRHDRQDYICSPIEHLCSIVEHSLVVEFAKRYPGTKMVVVGSPECPLRDFLEGRVALFT